MKTIIKSCYYVACGLLMLTCGAAEIVYAASNRVRIPTSTISATEQLVAKQYNSEKHSSNSHIILVTNWYSTLIENENFMKWQDMARYFWQQQTGEQRLMSNSYKRFSKRPPHPLNHTTPNTPTIPPTF
ncbi:hypothetical protein [Thiofilum flexile]|uniref:hypothetical protein n=1 Tax=Thiofilum flexile TaxID=125627 RepID=UPI000381D25B|nr:hypothetical protein [Thiofilum flexile]